MAAMRFLTEDQIRAIQAEIVASEIADDAARLCRRARSADCVLEIEALGGDSMQIVSVRPRERYVAARSTAVPA